MRSEDLSKVKDIVQDLREMLMQHPDLDRNQNMIARLNGFGPYSCDILLQAYTQTTDNPGFLKVKEDVLIKAAAVIERHGAQLASPTQFVYSKTIV